MRLADRADERLGAVGAGLEERPGRDPPPPTGHLLVEPRSRARRELGGRHHPHAVGHLGRRRVDVDDHEALAGAGAGPQDDLAVGEAAVGDQLVDQRVGDQARLHGDEVVAVPATEPEPAVRGHAAHGRAVAVGGQVGTLADRDVELAPAGAARRRRWRPSGAAARPGSTCCQSHPPHPAATNGHGGSTRSGEATSTLDHAARGEVLLLLVELDRAPSRRAARRPRR